MDSQNTSNDQLTTAEAERQFPVVLVIRDPDYSDQIELFGLPAGVRVVYMDLGSSFDVSHPHSHDQLEVSGWVEAHLEELGELPSAHGARGVMQAVIDRVCERFDLAPDGSLDDDWSSTA